MCNPLETVRLSMRSQGTPLALPSCVTHLLGVLLPVWLAAPPPGAATRIVLERTGLLVGTERGLYRQAEQGWRLVLARGAVLDLVSLEGGWLAAAEQGLYEARAGAVPRAHVLGAGARTRSLAVAPDGVVWAATDAGLYTRDADATEFALDTGLPIGPLLAVRVAGPQVWVARGGALWLRGADGVFVPRLRGLQPGWWELAGAAATEHGALLAVPRGLWRVEGGHVERVELAGRLHGVARTGDDVWLASTRGLLRTALDRLASAVPEVVVEGEAFAAVVGEQGLVVTTRSGVARVPFRRARLPREGGARLPSEPRGYRQPAVDPVQLQRAVIAYQGLSPRRLRRLSERARQTAWWPRVRLGAAWERDRDRDIDRDQTFSSGAIHDLLDVRRTTDTRVGFDLQFTWELGRLAEPDDQLAISRERREVIELRDQILERVNRLYFERQRVLVERSSAAPPERGALALRARELAARLDAWTGGTFSRLEAGAPHEPPQRRTP